MQETTLITSRFLVTRGNPKSRAYLRIRHRLVPWPMYLPLPYSSTLFVRCDQVLQWGEYSYLVTENHILPITDGFGNPVKLNKTF